MLQLLPCLFILDTLKRPPAVAVGEHQVVLDIHQYELHRHDAFAEGSGEGFSWRKVEGIRWIGNNFFHIDPIQV